jgi:hypothetical protein
MTRLANDPIPIFDIQISIFMCTRYGTRTPATRNGDIPVAALPLWRTHASLSRGSRPWNRRYPRFPTRIYKRQAPTGRKLVSHRLSPKGNVRRIPSRTNVRETLWA